ncbi:DUF2799 domain-containing protein [Vibrio sp. FNV 38]|nr:DUF2799 domain-containing protein [Vibrio sp. FNV 38]
MKLFSLLLLSGSIVGCAAIETPQSTSASVWHSYGLEQGEKGWVKLTQARLTELDTTQTFNQELYAAYTQGYEVGRDNYCQQSAFDLGLSGNTYLGVCDRQYPNYRQQYVSGKTAAEWGYNKNMHGDYL